MRQDKAPLTHDFHDPVAQKGAAALQGSKTLQVQLPDVFWGITMHHPLSEVPVGRGRRGALVVGPQMWYSEHCTRNQEPTWSKILSCQRMDEQFWAISLTFWKKQTWIHLLRSQDRHEDFSSNDKIPQKVFKTRAHLGRNKTKRYTNVL